MRQHDLPPSAGDSHRWHPNCGRNPGFPCSTSLQLTVYRQNDLGIKADDKEAMMARLVAQGIKDVASIDLKGSVDTPTQPAVSAPPAQVTQARVGRRVQGGAATIVLG